MYVYGVCMLCVSRGVKTLDCWIVEDIFSFFYFIFYFIFYLFIPASLVVWQSVLIINISTIVSYS